ncbi:MAG: CZB domain-containing protein [Candidatus Kryptoniota bacterium]
MIAKEAIDEAVRDHSEWKKRLREAITIGRSEFKIWVVKQDNECQFGKWLHSLSEEEMKSEDFQKVKTLHAEFHKVAGKVLEFALTGGKDAASKMMRQSGTYGDITGRFVLALNDWKNKL